jgi:hypothetical protein
MGGDGGVIASQRKFIRGAKDPDAVEEVKHVKQQQIMKSQICAQSSNRLEEPIVACELGHLFNKESILNALLEKSMNPVFSHIRGLKDVKTLIFTPNPKYSVANEHDGEYPSKFVCPITGMEFNGIVPFVVLWTSGVVLSDKAIREIGVDGLQSDYGPFLSEDIVRLIPIDGSEEAEQQRNRLLAKRKAKKESSKSHKRAQATDNTGDDNITDGDTNNHKKSKHETSSSSVANGANSESLKVKTTTSLKNSSQMVKSASEAIAGQESSSKVFKGLFHKDHEKDKYDRDLFMSVAGLRYTIS